MDLYRPQNLGRRLATQLDLRTVPSSLGPQLSDDKFTLHLLSRATQTSAAAAWLEDDASSVRLEIVAQADVNGDGKDDWIVWLVDEARDGNYRGYVTLVVLDCTRSGALAASVLAP